MLVSYWLNLNVPNASPFVNTSFNNREDYLAAFGNDRGIKTIDGMTGRASIPVLVAAKLSAPAYSQARSHLHEAMEMAMYYPDGVWDVIS